MSQTVEKPEAVKAPPKAEPERQHKWLQKLVGEWTYEVDAPAEPGKPASKVRGTDSVRSLGGIWVLAEGQGEMPGGGHGSSVMTIGYDPAKKRFVGTWVGSMMTHMWLYDGELDRDEKILTLNSEGPSLSGDGTMGKYQDVVEFKSDDHRTLTARTLTKDGKWEPFMTVEYRRKK